MDNYNNDLQLPIKSSNFPIIDDTMFLINKNQNLNLIKSQLHQKNSLKKENKKEQQKQTKFKFNLEYEINRVNNLFELNFYYEPPIDYIDYIMMKQIKSL